MYGIIVINHGMWGGFSCWCRRDGEIEKYATKEEANRVAEERNNRHGRVNSFNEYFAEKLNEGRF